MLECTDSIWYFAVKVLRPSRDPAVWETHCCLSALGSLSVQLSFYLLPTKLLTISLNFRQDFTLHWCREPSVLVSEIDITDFCTFDQISLSPSLGLGAPKTLTLVLLGVKTQSLERVVKIHFYSFCS